MRHLLAHNRRVQLETDSGAIDMSKLDQHFTTGQFEDMSFTQMGYCRIILQDDKTLLWTTDCTDQYPGL